MNTMQTEIAIVGGGPAGLMLAVELGCRDIPCVLLEEDADPPAFPKANATSARTMEHYRRRGFSDEIRALGLPLDYPQDVVYCTQLAEHELARFRIPSRGEVARRGEAGSGDTGDYGSDAWPTPELPHRVQQMLIEPVLRRRAAAYPSVRLCLGQRAVAVEQDEQGATAVVEPEGGGDHAEIDAVAQPFPHPGTHRGAEERAPVQSHEQVGVTGGRPCAECRRMSRAAFVAHAVMQVHLVEPGSPRGVGDLLRATDTMQEHVGRPVVADHADKPRDILDGEFRHAEVLPDPRIRRGESGVPRQQLCRAQ